MLIDATVHLPVSLAMLDGIFKAPDAQELMRISFRWLHFLAGITWIGLLYFFNLVNVPLQKKLDPDTKKKSESGFAGQGALVFPLGRGNYGVLRSRILRDVHSQDRREQREQPGRPAGECLEDPSVLAGLSHLPFPDSVPDHQESSGADQRRTRVRDRHDYSRGRVHLRTAEILSGSTLTRMDEQQDPFDRRRWRLRYFDDAERLGNHLAGQQANPRRLAGRTAGRA